MSESLVSAPRPLTPPEIAICQEVAARIHATTPPTPPSWVEIDADFVAAQLSALGVTDHRSIDDRVHDVYVEHWRTHHRAPSVHEVATVTGTPAAGLSNILGRMGRAGRMIRLGRGEWLPVVVEKK